MMDTEEEVSNLRDFASSDDFIRIVPTIMKWTSWFAGTVWTNYKIQLIFSYFLCIFCLYCTLYNGYYLFLEKSFFHIESKVLGIIIYLFAVFNVIGFRRLRVMWPKVTALWIKTEHAIVDYVETDRLLRRKLLLTAFGAFVLIIAEYSIRLVASITESEPRTLQVIYSHFALRSEVVMVQTVEESLRPEGVFVIFMTMVISVLVNFRDLTVSLFSLGLASKQRRINILLKDLCQRRTQTAWNRNRYKSWMNRSWRRTRETYVMYATLVRTTNKALGPLVLSCCIENMFFITRVLYLGRNFYSYKVVNLAEKASYTYQLVILLVRGVFVLLSAATLNLEYEKSLYHFHGIDTNTYNNTEVRRLLYQMKKEAIAIRVLGNFKLNRYAVVRCVTIVLTYELMIAQSKSK